MFKMGNIPKFLCQHHWMLLRSKPWCSNNYIVLKLDVNRAIYTICLHILSVCISKGDTKDRGAEIRDLDCRIRRCGVVLLKKADKTPIANKITANASPTLVRGKSRTSLVSKKALQEQIKLAGVEIDKSRKTILALGLGPKSGQVQRNLVGVEKQVASLRKKFPGIAQRKNEAHQCILELITKQQA